jgi:ribosomal protein L10
LLRCWKKNLAELPVSSAMLSKLELLLMKSLSIALLGRLNATPTQPLRPKGQP